MLFNIEGQKACLVTGVYRALKQTDIEVLHFMRLSIYVLLIGLIHQIPMFTSVVGAKSEVTITLYINLLTFCSQRIL